MKRLITISYTSLDAPGGVPAFNRALHAAFPDRECIHFCWEDFPYDVSPFMREIHRAFALNQSLKSSGLIDINDTIVCDGFWASGLEGFPHCVSHSHGIWSHRTHHQVLAGMSPDMPQHHSDQVSFRRSWCSLGKPITAVSKFIADEMEKQWGFKVDRVINNGVDIKIFKPMKRSSYLKRPLLIHGINDRSNFNKGWDHIEEIISDENIDADVMSLDEAFEKFRSFSDRPWKKHEILSQADIVIHPSGFEGNSMFVAEALASGRPVMGYNVGYLYTMRPADDENSFVIPLEDRSPKTFSFLVGIALRHEKWFLDGVGINARKCAERDLSLENFNNLWREYLSEIEETR